MKLPSFYPILDADRVPAVPAAEALLEAGARILQFRNKSFFSRKAFEEASRIAELCRQAGALFIVNDRADIAMLLNAGLHLGQEDIAAADARRVMPAGSIIGFSTHNEQQLRAGDAEPVDYLAIGPIFTTGSKQNPDPVVGVQRLLILRPLTAKPLVAIGGITRELAPQVFQAGADAVAIIGDLIPNPCTPVALRARAAEWVAISASARGADVPERT
jgi:thiamine-phosphate pyrophosphorylase